MPTFHVSIDPPKYGWLPITLDIDGSSYSFAASDVLNDPVTELATACVKVLDGQGTAMIGFWLEPLWHLLELATDGNGQTTVTFSYLADENQRNPQCKLSTTDDTKSLCRHILMRLRSMHVATGADCYPADECWGMQFPDDKISTAFDRIRAQTGG